MMSPFRRRVTEQGSSGSRRRQRIIAWLGFIGYVVVIAAVFLPIMWVMGRNSPGEFLIGMGVALVVTGFVTPYLPESWPQWPWQSRRDFGWTYFVFGAEMLICGLVYHFTQNIFVAGAAYVLAILVGVIGYFRVDALLHRQETEAYKRDRSAWEQRRREQQVHSRIEYRLRR